MIEMAINGSRRLKHLLPICAKNVGVRRSAVRLKIGVTVTSFLHLSALGSISVASFTNKFGPSLHIRVRWSGRVEQFG